jgi:hypothetical protein
LTMNTKELFDVLVLLSEVLHLLVGGGPSSSVDPVLAMQIGLVLKYTLPLCSPTDQIFQVCANLFTVSLVLCQRYSLNSLSLPTLPPSIIVIILLHPLAINISLSSLPSSDYSTTLGPSQAMEPTPFLQWALVSKSS